MSTLYDTLIELAHNEDGSHVEYVDTFMNTWMKLREDKSNLDKMKQLVVFVNDLMIDSISDDKKNVTELLQIDTANLIELMENVHTIPSLEELIEKHVFDVFSILSKI